MSAVKIMVDVPMSASTCGVPIVVNVLLDTLFYLINENASEKVNRLMNIPQ